MKHVTLLGLATAALPASALADADNGWTYGYGSMMGGGWGGGFFRGFSGNRGGTSRRDALETLRERFAAGEIDEEEYNRRKRVLEG